MITLLIGENSFEIERKLAETTSAFSGQSEKIDGSKLQLSELPDILMGSSLFSESRLLIVRGLSENKAIWPKFGDWLPRISDDINLVLIEPKPDKRTVTFKALKSMATVFEFPSWTERDVFKAEQWVMAESKKLDLNLDKKSAQTLVYRVGVDQWRLYHALEKLALNGEVSVDIINDLIEANPSDNVFNLFETALSGNATKLQQMIKNLEQTDDVYRISALLFSQAFQLLVITAAGEGDNPSKDFDIHPFVLSKMTPIAKKLGKSGVDKIINVLAEADDDMKSSSADPWLLLERALQKIANI